MIIGSLSNDYGDSNENGKKTTTTTTTLHVHHAFLFISQPSLHDYDVKLPNFIFCGGHEHKKTTFLFFSWTLIQSFRIQLQLETFANIWGIERDGISAVKFEALSQIHFLSDVFVVVVVVVS